MATYNIHGFTLSQKGQQPLPMLRVEAWDKELLIEERIGVGISDEKGAFTITFKEAFYREIIFSRTPDVYFKVFKDETLLLDTKDRIFWNVHQPDEKPVLYIAEESVTGLGSTGVFTLSGTIATDTGTILAGAKVTAYDKGIDGDLALGNTLTDPSGNYKIIYSQTSLKGKLKPDLQIAVADPGNEQLEIARSPVSYNAGNDTTISLAAPAAKVTRPSEYERLLSDIKPALGDKKLRDLKEDDANDNITHLANKSGWDARAVAMAAQADLLNGQTGIDPIHYYALFRSGVAGDAAALSQLSGQYIEDTINMAAQNKIIPAGTDVSATLKIQQAQSSAWLLKTPVGMVVSSLGTMLDLRLNQDQQQVFVQTYTQSAQDQAGFWSALQSKGFSQETITRLQTDGRLGYLTLQNAPLVKRIYDTYQISDPADLVRAGLYKADAWKNVIGQDIPSGLTADEYAAGLAAQIVLSYPTQVTAEMVSTGAVLLGDNAPKQEVYQFLSSNSSRYTIGLNPAKTWDGFANLSSDTQASVKKLERLYQLSPSNEAMTALSALPLDSAYQITRYNREEFKTRFGSSFPNSGDADMIYTKAHEVYSTVINVATGYINYRTTPNIYAITGQQQKTQDDIIAYPTLEELFGNMDYCACDECKSVLGAAAYLVDLLQFIDLTGKTFDKQNPIDVLLGRRPDIQHIQLTCENTNIALPYIDLVNEILEYYIVNGNLTDFAGHDMTPDSNTNDLLADPQYVMTDAYDNHTKQAVYPYILPFDQALEALRLLFQVWGTTLEQVLGVFRTQLLSRTERLSLNQPEYQILTDSTYRTLPEYFGEPAGNTIDQLNTAVAAGKTFCRRVDIMYDDLVSVLETQFINPGILLVPALEKIQVGLDQVQALYDGTITDAAFEALLPADLDPDDYGGNVPAWLRTNKDLISGLITLTDIAPGTSECDFAEVELRYALPADMTLNRLSAISYHKLHRFIRLWKKEGWSIQTLDTIIAIFYPIPLQTITAADIDASFVILLARIANFSRLMDHLSVSENKFPDWLLLWNMAIDLPLRQQQLAKLLKMRPEDMLDLSTITGIDPLVMDLDNDLPSLPHFVSVLEDCKAVPLKVNDLDYILRHKDSSGKLTLTEADLLKNMKGLRDTMNGIEADLSKAPDNADFTYAKSKMALVYDPSVVDSFFELLAGTKTYTAPLSMIEEFLPKKLTDADAGLGYDPFKKWLTYAGVMTDPAKSALDTAADSLVLADVATITLQADLDMLKTNFKAAVLALQISGNADLAAFGVAYPELLAIYSTVKPIADPAAQLTALLNSLLPELKMELKVNALRQSLASQLNGDPEIIGSLTGDPAVLQAASDTTKTILYDFMQLEGPVSFTANASYGFYIDFPATDDYLLYVDAPTGTKISLTVDGQPVITGETTGASGEVQNVSPLSLNAGNLYLLQLDLAALPAGQQALLRWRTKGMAKAVVPAAKIYDKANVANAQISFIRLQKAVQLQTLLKLTSVELPYFAAMNTETKNFLNDLFTDDTISDADLHALWNKIYALVYFNLVKEANEPADNTWVQILQQPDTTTPQGKSLLLGVNGWKDTDLNTVLTQLGLTLDQLSALSILKRVMQAMTLVNTIGYDASQIIGWATNTPANTLISDIKASIRLRTDDQAWLNTMQSVSDPLRNLRRDALVAYILHHQQPLPEVVNADQLYEYFLIDVQMDACMQTSRIRQALSTVQLFIQRCLINLEDNVASASINPKWWAWMNRYRVWEANREIFLFPENWLDPELRDDKSSFFTELEGDLLQADITDDLAETAFLNYLKKLDEVARLEIAGMYLQENEQGNPDDNILHVFGRTNGNTRQYYYRKFAYGYWSPWEKISVNIEGEQIFPIIWKSRLFLFWLNIIVKPAAAENKSPWDMRNDAWTTSTNKNVEINMCWAEYYQNKWTSPKSSDLNNPVLLNNLTSFNPANILLYAKKEKKDAKTSEHLIFSLVHMGADGINLYSVTYTSKNAAPIVEAAKADNDLIYNVALFNYELFRSGESTQLNYNKLAVAAGELDLVIQQPQFAAGTTLTEKVLTKSAGLFSGFNLLPLRHPVENQYQAPFFYSDERSTFYVRPTEKDITPLWGYFGYYDFGLVSANAKVYIPPVMEKPVVNIPPEGIIKDTRNPIVDPWTELQTNVNPNFDKVLPGTANFNFDKATFGVGGNTAGFNISAFTGSARDAGTVNQ